MTISFNESNDLMNQLFDTNRKQLLKCLEFILQFGVDCGKCIFYNDFS